MRRPGFEEKDGAPEARRRAAAAFALEAAALHIDQGEAATKLLEWGCRQVRRSPEPGEFEHRWHLAAIALFEGAVDPDGLESHVTHVKFQFPQEPRLAFTRAVAAELRATPFITGNKVSAKEVEKRLAEAARRYEAAAAEPTTKADVGLRLGHVRLEQGQPDAALTALAAVEPNTHDRDLVYLSRLFQGLADDRLGRADEARAAFESALTVSPGAQSATMALSALLFRHGQRDLAGRIVAEVLSRATVPDDPWWWYWPADFRQAGQLIAAMREALK